MSNVDRRACDIEPRKPQWILDRRAPRGAISLLVGADGSGKSTFIASLTAGWTRGELTGQTEEVHLSLVEDDVEAVTVPRLIAAGAALDRAHLPARCDAWAFPRDLDRFAEYIVEKRITIAVLDPLDHHVDDIAGQAGRQTLGRLAALVEATGVGLIIVHHFNKAGKSIGVAIGGGRGVKGVARSILIWGDEPLAPIIALRPATDPTDDETDSSCSVLAHFKSSYGPRQPSLLFERIEHPHPADASLTVTSYGLVGESGYTPEQVFQRGSAIASELGQKRRIARELILRALSLGPRAAEDLRSDIVVAGISERAFTRARAELARESVIEGYQELGRHWWRLAVPDPPPA